MIGANSAETTSISTDFETEGIRSMRPSVRQQFITLALLASTAFSTGASADMSEFGESVGEYFSATGSHFLTGLNGVITAPADPVMNLVAMRLLP